MPRASEHSTRKLDRRCAAKTKKIRISRFFSRLLEHFRANGSRECAPDDRLRGHRFASRKRVKTKDCSPVPIPSERKGLWWRFRTLPAVPPASLATAGTHSNSRSVPCGVATRVQGDLSVVAFATKEGEVTLTVIVSRLPVGWPVRVIRAGLLITPAIDHDCA